MDQNATNAAAAVSQPNAEQSAAPAPASESAANPAPSEKTIELAHELVESLEADKAKATSTADPAPPVGEGDPPVPEAILGSAVRHPSDGRAGTIASLRRNDQGQIEAVRLQIGQTLTDWLAEADFTARPT